MLDPPLKLFGQILDLFAKKSLDTTNKNPKTNHSVCIISLKHQWKEYFELEGGWWGGRKSSTFRYWVGNLLYHPCIWNVVQNTTHLTYVRPKCLVGGNEIEDLPCTSRRYALCVNVYVSTSYLFTSRIPCRTLLYRPEKWATAQKCITLHQDIRVVTINNFYAQYFQISSSLIRRMTYKHLNFQNSYIYMIK